MTNQMNTLPELPDMTVGYFDGLYRNSPEPSGNRSHCYTHGFRNGRDDLNHSPRALASVLREEATLAEIADMGILL